MNIDTAASWSFSVAAIVLIAAVIAKAFSKNTKPIVTLLFAAGICAFFGRLDRLERFKLSPTGGLDAEVTQVHQVVADATNALQELRKVAALASLAIVQLDATQGELGGNSAAYRDSMKDRLVSELHALGSAEVDIEAVEKAAQSRDTNDYLTALTQRPYTYDIQGEDKKNEWYKSYSPQFGTMVITSPDGIRQLLDRFNVHDPVEDEILDDFRYY